MFCRKCGKKLSASTKFCGLCGAQTKFAKETTKPTEQIEETKDGYIVSPYTQKESTYAPLPTLAKNKDSSSKVLILITLVVVSTLLASSLWLYKNYDEEKDQSKSDVENDKLKTSDATVHIQLNSWRTLDMGQDMLSFPDPWIRIYTDNGEYRNTKVWKDSLEWYGNIEFEFDIQKDNFDNNSLGIAIELYDSDGQSSQNPRVGNSTLMDINPNLSGSTAESKRIGFWYNLSTEDNSVCVTAFEIEDTCQESVSLSSGLPRYNLVEIEVNGEDDGDNNANQFDSYLRFIIWWELKEEPNLSDDFYIMDSDGDGVKDYIDYNDEIDVGVTITLEEFGIASNYDEYMNLEVFINGDSRYLLGQTGDSIRIQGGQMEEFNESFFFDIDDTIEYTIIQFVAYSSGWLFNSNFDLDGKWDDSNILTLYFYSNTGELSDNYNDGYADGSEDTGGDAVTDAMLQYSVVTTDTASLGETRTFEWNYGSKNYNYEMYIDPDVYYYFKSLDHDLSYEADWPAGYARFTTPDEQYVINLANDLNDMAVAEGFTELETANFILSFVQTIDYKVDNYTNYQGIQEYPKYPVEMLWDGQGDCEDSSALYASLMEALGHDAVLLLFLGNIEGHAAIGISVPGASGKSYQHDGVDYYYAETTDTGPLIGDDPTYYFPGLDMNQASYIYDV